MTTDERDQLSVEDGVVRAAQVIAEGIIEIALDAHQEHQTADDAFLAYLPIYSRLVESVQRVHGADAAAVLRGAHQLVKQAHDLAQRFA